ncbi:MAG: ATP-binding protein, partial [Burkholderiales bacterium]
MPARLAPDDGAPQTALSPPAPPGAASTRRVLVLLALGALLLLVGATSVILSLSREAAALHEAAAVEEAQRVVRSATGMRDFYSAEVVPRAREAGVPITHDYRAQPGTLPLPATMMLELGPWMDRAGDSTRMRLYSDRPFPWRAASRSFDGFERDALAALRADPDTPFVRIEEAEGRRVLRYAVADRLKASCVECHNRYPGSPKTDWAVGEVRGVLEVASPIADGVALLEGGMRRALAMSVVVVACAIGLVAVAFRGLQGSARSSERLAEDREAANLQLRGEVARRAETEAILRFSESTLRATFDGMQDGVLVFDRAMRIVQCNRVASAMFGYAAHQLPGTSVLGLLPGEALEETGPGRRRIEGMRRDGERFAADVAVSEIRMGDAPYFAALVSDATAQVRYERELAAARDAALDTARAKSQFLANMSHEIRTPMNGVIGVTGLLRDTALTAEQAGLVDTVQRSANALLTIIDDILDLSKIEAGRFRLHRTDFDPVEIVEDTLELLAERAAVRGLRLGYAVDGPMPAAIHTDEVRLRQVLNNLVGNAVKFTSEGEVTLRLVYLAAERRLEVRVRDTGPGIPAERIGDLFQPFSQIDGSATRRFGGTGLGLAISRQLVELMGGTISVTSREGEGSEFRFTIDWLPPAGPPAEAPPARTRLAGRALRIVGFDPVQRAQLASWGLVLHDE